MGIKETFTIGDKEYAVLEPTREMLGKTRGIYSQVLGEALSRKAPLRDALFKYMREQGLWDDAKDKEYTDLQKSLDSNELKLAKGGIKLSQAREIAIQLRRDRFALRLLLMEQNRLDAYTVEGMAHNAQFDSLTSMCIVDNITGKPIFASPEDYELRKDEEVAIKGATIFAKIYYKYDDNIEQSLPENAFLQKFNFVDEKFRLVNETGQLIDGEGKLINEDGQYIDEDGNLLDIEGNHIDAKGNFVVDFEPFLDDDGVPIDITSPAKKIKKTTKKKTVSG